MRKIPTARLSYFGLAFYFSIFPAAAVQLPGDVDKVLPCRPTVSCTADLAAPGTSELETGYLFRSSGAAGNQSSLPFLTKLTLAPWSQLQIGSNGYTFSEGPAPFRYFDDLTVGGKLHFLDQTAKMPSISFSVAANLPTAENQAGYLRAYDALFTLYASEDFGAVHIDFNTGFNLLSIGDSPMTQEFLSLALSYNLSDRLTLEAESYYFTEASPVSAKDAGFRVATAYALRPWLTFDLGGDAGFIPANRIYSVFSGFSVVPAVFGRR